MNIWKISVSNIVHKPLYAFLSVFSLSISIGLLFGIQQLDSSIQNQFENSLGTIDMVVGAKGSPLQLVLASVLQIDNPTGNIYLKEARQITNSPLIEKAVPISYGDSYKGYRIVGTTTEFAPLYNAKIDVGRQIETSMEVVLGSTVAATLNLKIGDTFLSSHGLVENTQEVHHHHPLKVVGIYKATYNVLDRLIVTDLESIWDVHSHEAHTSEAKDSHLENHSDHEGHHEENHSAHQDHHEEDHGKEITSMLVSFRSPMGLLTIPRKINKESSMQAALPKYELERLFSFTGVGVKAVSWIAYIILAISCITIFISLFKMVKERAFDLALMRTYGASNFQLIRIVAYEGFILVVASLLVGAALAQIGLWLVVQAFNSSYNQMLVIEFPLQELLQTVLLIVLMVVLAILLAILPIIKLNISKIISNEK